MAKYVIEDTTLTDIAEKIRYHNENTEKITPEEIPDRIDLMAETKVTQGKKDAYDAFWDGFQKQGARTDYYASFAGAGWTKETFLPKHDIKPSGSAYGLFQKSRISGDLVGIAQKQGIVIDFSKATNLQYAFSNTSFSRLGLIDASKSDSLIRGFELSSSLKIIDKIVLSSNGNTGLSNAFNDCSSLEEIRFEGVIGTNGVSFGDCRRLSHESLISIINALKDRSGESAAYTCTLGGENLAKLTVDEIKMATDKGWTLL